MVQIPINKEVQTIFLLSSEKLLKIVRRQKWGMSSSHMLCHFAPQTNVILEYN
jgi:hypothetical protein